MREATITELRAQASRFFALGEAGETIRVTRRGRPIAEIRPVAANLPSFKRRPARPLAVRGSLVRDLILAERGP